MKEITSYIGWERTTLLIADVGLTQQDKDSLRVYSIFYGFNLYYFTDIQTLNDYIKDGGTDFERSDDPITRFRVFSHGTIGSIEFGGGHSENSNNLSWTIDAIIDSGIDSSAFKKTDSVFYSCYTGTPIDGTSFAQQWSDITGGKTKAAVGRTDYEKINSPTKWDPISWSYWIDRKIVGYSQPYTAYRKPGLGSDAAWQTFRPT